MNRQLADDTMAAICMRNESVLALVDFKPVQVQFLIDLAAYLKQSKANHTEIKTLTGKNVALIFEKGSTRTRCSFEVACADQGAHTTYLGPDSGSHFGKKETVKDSARVLGRMYDAIVYRGHGQSVVETLKKWSGVPVINALTDEFHPTQGLADLLTLKESNPDTPWSSLKVVYVGDARNNISNSLIVACVQLGVEVGILAPKELQPEAWFWKLLDEKVAPNLAHPYRVTVGTADQKEDILRNANAVYTDVWVSMGEPKEAYKTRLELLKAYQVNQELMALAAPTATFMHCLPANQDMESTAAGREILADFGEEYSTLFESDSNVRTGRTEKGMECTAAVLEGPQSVVFRQAENRLHTIKALTTAVLANDDDSLAANWLTKPVLQGIPELKRRMTELGFDAHVKMAQQGLPLSTKALRALAKAAMDSDDYDETTGESSAVSSEVQSQSDLTDDSSTSSSSSRTTKPTFLEPGSHSNSQILLLTKQPSTFGVVGIMAAMQPKQQHNATMDGIDANSSSFATNLTASTSVETYNTFNPHAFAQIKKIRHHNLVSSPKCVGTSSVASKTKKNRNSSTFHMM